MAVIVPGRWSCFWSIDRKLVRLTIDGRDHDFSVREAADVALGMRAAIDAADAYGEAIPDTERPTRRDTPQAMAATPPKRSSGTMAAVTPRGCPTCGRPRRYVMDPKTEMHCEDGWHRLGDSQPLGDVIKDIFDKAKDKEPKT
jgi:hypothetical protein